MDVDGSAERRGPSAACGCGCCSRGEHGETETVERGRQGARYGAADIWPRHGRRTDVSRLQTRGERRKKRRRGRAGVAEERERHTEGTCYALRDMAEARGIHNFVKTKMLRSCLGGVAFFLVSRNVQARLSLRPAAACPFLSLCPSPRRFFSPSLSLSPPSRFSLSRPLLRPAGVLLVRVTRIIPFSFLR